MLQRSVGHLRLVKECGWEGGAREAWSEVEGGGLHLVHHQALSTGVHPATHGHTKMNRSATWVMAFTGAY